MTYPCAECGEQYEQGRRRATPYCPDCRRVRKLANMRVVSRDRRARAARENVSDVLDDYLRQGMDPDYVELMRARVDDHLDDVIPAEWSGQSEVPLSGANTAAGPDEGTSTYFADLADELDALHDRAVKHGWWLDNPNWWVKMHLGFIPATVLSRTPTTTLRIT